MFWSHLGHGLQASGSCLQVTIYGHPPASWPTAIIFYCWCCYPLYFLPPDLGGLWADRNLSHVSRWL